MSALVARLNAEQAATSSRILQAVLLHERAVLEEAAGEEPIAARDYLAAFNAEPSFREPLEALVRILTRRKSVKNLGKLLEALTRVAETPEERARAHWERATYLSNYEHDLGGAKEALEAAISANPEDPTAWLELELVAARDGDVEGRMRAVEARAELAVDPTWKALLLIDLALLAWKGGAAARAYELLDAAGALGGRAGFRTRQALEQIATGERDPALLAHALEGQADMIAEAIEDAAAGDATGVPLSMRTAAHAAEAWFRAAELKRRLGDTAGWTALLARAADRLPESSVIARARIVSLEAAGDGAGAAALARAELDRGAKGPGAAALWLRVAEAAALRADRAAALEALRAALAADPKSIPARALEIDLLGDGQDPTLLAESIEASAETFGSDDAKGRAYLLAAFVWACLAGDAARAKTALSEAGVCGVAPGLVSRIARMLAAVGRPQPDGAASAPDAGWYEEATKRLLQVGAEPAEQASLWFELGRARLLRGDEVGAAEAFSKIATAGGDDGGAGPSAWLGRVLGAYAIGLLRRDGEPEDAPRTLSAAAAVELSKVEADAAIARGLSLVAALRAVRLGEIDRARAVLRELCEALPGDEVAAVFLAELERRAGDSVAAAVALGACAAAAEEDDVAAALHIESGLLLWRAGERTRAIAAIEAASAGAARASATVLTWALRGADADSAIGRRRAIEAAAQAGGDATAVALERFGLEVASADGDAAAAIEALEVVEREGAEDLASAAALGRLLVPVALEDRGAVEHALDELVACGGDGEGLADAERFRLARALDRDVHAAAERAAAWAASSRGLYAAVEWLAAGLAADDHVAEANARRAVAGHLGAAPGAAAELAIASEAARAAMEASAALVLAIDQPGGAHPFVDGDAAVARLANLELAAPGSDPHRRSAALRGLGDALGTEAELDALSLSGWSHLAAGEAKAAHEAFRAVVDRRPRDLASWEGARSAAEALGDSVGTALAAAQLGALSADDARGAELWEQAGLVLLEKTEAHDDAEIAFDRAFGRDPRRSVAFDKLFRRLRARNEDDRLLDVIERRLDVAEDEQEIGKLYWERARVLRKKGDRDGALQALENVTLLEPDHVGALALSGEIQISRGDFAQAASTLARLATIKEAPKQQRLVSGIAAVDMYETRLGALDKALEVLVGLHRSGLSTLAVRERLARVAAKAGAWEDATSILEQLMQERETREGRIEAARLALVIWRDKVKKPLRAEAATAKLLDESPDDGEALDLVLTTGFDPGFRSRALGRGKATLVQALASSPADVARVTMLAKIAGAGQDAALRQATLGALVALGNADPALSDELARIDTRVSGRPEIVLDARALTEIADPQDAGPVAVVFAGLAETIGLALGPSLASLGVTRKERIDARGGHPVRMAVAEWMGALGFEGDFDVYVGGPNPRGVHGIAGEQPAIVLGGAVTAPFDMATRSALAREVFALRRGVTAVRVRDDNTIASVVIAACGEAGLPVQPPPYAVYGEVARAIRKEISRKVKKAILEPCQRFMQAGQDPRAWAAAARRSLDRMAVIAAGDVSIVLSDVLGAPRNELGALVAENERALRLLAFVLSPNYLELRRKLGMGVR
jgi:tetratricopeptide (TPR) repeat protein